MIVYKSELKVGGEAASTTYDRTQPKTYLPVFCCKLLRKTYSSIRGVKKQSLLYDCIKYGIATNIVIHLKKRTAGG